MIPDDWLEILKTEYPKRYGGQGWVALKRLIPARLSEGCTWDEILEGTKAYKKYCDHTGKTGTELVKMAQTFYGRDCWFAEDWSMPEPEVRYRRPEEITEEQRKADAAKAWAELNRLRGSEMTIYEFIVILILSAGTGVGIALTIVYRVEHGEHWWQK